MKPVTLATLVLVAACATASDRLGKTVGVYHWGSQVPRSMSDGVQATAALGGRVVRLALSSRHEADYAAGRGCNESLSLPVLVQREDVREALDNPDIDVYILTAYDSLSLGDCEHPPYLRPSFYTPETERAIARQYSDLTLYLYQKFAGTRKRFIVSNWESDNAIYCMNAYGYANDPAIREACDAAYPSAYGNPSPDDSFQALRRWFEARYRGILDGKARAASVGLGGSRVYFAPEINSVRILRDAGLKSVLYDVIPYIQFDYVSYSAWESINAFDAAAQLEQDLDTIEQVAGTSAIFLGEVGYSRMLWGGSAAQRLSTVIHSALNWGIAYVIVWNLYDQPGEQCGLFAIDGGVTALGTSFHNELSGATGSSRAAIRTW